MSKNLKSSTKLTEFPPLPPEEKPQSVGQFLSSFFKITKPTTPEDTVPNVIPSDTLQDPIPSWASDVASSTSYTQTDLEDTVFSVDVNEGRSLPNVLKRISNLLALKSNNLQDYADTELKQYWMPDSVSKECYECCEKFTTFRRRHHCRVCGQIFCSQCCNQQIPGKVFGCTGDLRVCTYCRKVVLSYLQSSETGGDINTNLKLLQANLKTKLGFSTSPGSSVTGDNLSPNVDRLTAEDNSCTLKRKISVGYQEEKFGSEGSATTYLSSEEKYRALQNSVSLRNLFHEMCKTTTGIPLDTHRYRLRNYTDCFLGSELVDWLICQQKAKTRIQASAFCQALIEGGYIECISEPQIFIDGYSLYKIGFVVSPDLLQSNNATFDVPLSQEPSWVQQIPHESSTTDSDNEQLSPVNQHGRFTSSSSYMLDLNIEANAVYLSKPPESRYSLQSPDNDHGFREPQETSVVRQSEQREFVPESGWHNALSLREENGEHLAYKLLTETYKQHEQSLLKQLLSAKGLALSWADIILPLTHDLINIIRPDKNHNAADLDIRNYVQFKKLPGGLRNDTSLIGGVVCSKNVAHKGMLTDIDNPKLLLLHCSIVYQRTEGRLMALEPVLMQEHEYLRHVAARIVALQPSVVLVHKNVSRIAQDLLREHKITLVHNVKLSILERLSRCTQADLVTSVDAHIGRPRLGTCKRFHLKTFHLEKGRPKTLMFFEGLPAANLGSTVILRGGTKSELTRLQKVAALVLFTAYNWRLEKSFLMDEFAQPPNSACEFLDDSKETSPDIPSGRAILDELIERQDSDNDEVFVKKSAAVRKPDQIVVENRKSVTQTIQDFTDPLQSYDNDDELSKNYRSNDERFVVSDLPFSNNFRKALDDTILCISPYLVFSVPYLETDAGKKCKLRQFFAADIYFSEQFGNAIKNKWKEPEEEVVVEDKPEIKPLHPFLTTQITCTVDSANIQNLIANFRACGGRYEKKQIICVKEPVREKEETCETEIEKLDVLDPNNHQKLAVLFCSYSNESNNAPAFCVNPWVVDMDFYGRNDISLGHFLEKYCFRPTYMCPSETCGITMIKHIRRFVHNAGCVSIYLNNLETEFAEENIVLWTWCTKCQAASPVVPMSADTWSYSFAKYLELKFHGDFYNRRGQTGCTHSLHQDHFQYFAYRNYVASFKYTTVKLWEIALPPYVVQSNFHVDKQHTALVDEIKLMALRGYEIFSLIEDKLPCLPNEELVGLGNLKQLLAKEHAQFRQRVEEVQLKLTSPSIEIKEFDHKEVYLAYWKISDTLVRLKRLIVETVESWNLRLTEATRKRDGNEKKKDKIVQSESENSTPMENKSTEDALTNKSEEDSEVEKSAEHDVKASPKHYRSQSDGTVITQSRESDSKKDSDKKSVKNIFSQLLPSSVALTLIPAPFNSQDHYTLPTGVSVPVVVYENEPSSIVAYALNSYDYKKSFEELTLKRPQSVEQTPSPTNKRKIYSDSDKDGLLGFLRNKDSKEIITSLSRDSLQSDSSSLTEASQAAIEKSEDIKKSKNVHIEVQFQDTNCNFFCRIYLAEQFATLRSLVVPLGEEAFIRSLARSVQWNARGGKSGSNFAKTSDDRFILKEMSQNEVHLFLKSSNNYFDYMHKCCTTKQPTLLGKIVGIYQIIYKNNSNASLRTHLLVMENLFYNRTVSQKFDLKGSMRNRLVNTDNQEGEIVLLDENLLKMSCDSPLYILPHSKAALTAAIQNDTEFLSAQSVMDYSLLVGLDPDNKELILGIIDYIRTFTWDKKIETMVKKSGLLGGQGKLPTIVSPEEYQKRFIEAMHKYFLVVPDHWVGLGKVLD